jgi:AcrR family transcriptional regulator
MNVLCFFHCHTIRSIRQDEHSFFLYDGDMPKVTQQYRDARRAQILDAARRCFLREGFHATSMQDLFAEAGLSSGAVYRYFSGKDDVIAAIAEENMRDVVAMIQDVAGAQRERSLGEVMAAVFDAVRTKHERDGLGGLALLVWAESLRNRSLAARFESLLDTLRAELVGIVREHHRTTKSAGATTPEALAEVLLATVPGYILQLALRGEPTVRGIPDAVRALWP